MLRGRHWAGLAKLIWMIRRLGAPSDHTPTSPGILEAPSGLARCNFTLLRSLYGLKLDTIK